MKEKLTALVSGFILGSVWLAGVPPVDGATATNDWGNYPQGARVILENTAPLQYPLGARLPLFLWPAHDAIVEDASLQESIVRDLNARGVAVIASWQPGTDRDRSLQSALQVGRIQERLGLKVCVNANACMYGFYTGDPDTAHLDESGHTFFDDSLPGGKMGCPFRVKHRFAAVREQISFFLKGYQKEGVTVDFVYGDWEIDGPMEVNRAWDSARRCVVCRRNIAGIDDFRVFQAAVRRARNDATRICYTEPILERFPNAMVGNYGVYPNDGYRYWFDYFETIHGDQPHRKEERAIYREWPNDFSETGYTLAMPVIYPWARIYDWYEFPASDVRWFHNMLLIASSAGRNTKAATPLVPFIHWQTVFDPDPENDRVRQMSEVAYREMLWHSLLRGMDSFFMWCVAEQSAREVRLVHAAWAESLEWREWFEKGEFLRFDTPVMGHPVVSAVRFNERVLVRRTDFNQDHPEPVEMIVAGQILRIARKEGNQVLRIP
jgi:hypothetical protein